MRRVVLVLVPAPALGGFVAFVREPVHALGNLVASVVHSVDSLAWCFQED